MCCDRTAMISVESIFYLTLFHCWRLLNYFQNVLLDHIRPCAKMY